MFVRKQNSRVQEQVWPLQQSLGGCAEASGNPQEAASVSPLAAETAASPGWLEERRAGAGIRLSGDELYRREAGVARQAAVNHPLLNFVSGAAAPAAGCSGMTERSGAYALPGSVWVHGVLSKPPHCSHRCSIIRPRLCRNILVTGGIADLAGEEVAAAASALVRQSCSGV